MRKMESEEIIEKGGNYRKGKREKEREKYRNKERKVFTLQIKNYLYNTNNT